ncbi:lonely Cys domain-containing protein, partial [Streptomyces bluensis]|uniref:lonely Cys domain-containing protein n=1 Tax=Streptomyces bluensis TaxID=33897 RepID=UPI00167BB835
RQPLDANPVRRTQAENETWAGFRALWDQAEGTHVPQPHAPVAAPPPAPATAAVPAAHATTIEAHPAPPATAGATAAHTAALTDVLRRAFGPQVESHQLFSQMLNSLAWLDTARAGDRDGRFATGPIDLERITRYVLHLDPSVAVDPALYFDALSVTGSAARRGRAGSVAAVAAYQLERTGALGPHTALNGSGGQYIGRNLTGRPGLNLLLDRVSVEGQSTQVAPPWGARAVTVVATRGPSGLLTVPDGRGGTVEVDDEQFAELVARDPDRPPGVPLVLLAQDAGENLARLVADRSGVRAWFTYGDFRLQPLPGGNGWLFPALANSDPGRAPVGAWIPSDPGLVADDPRAQITAADGTAFADDDVWSFALPTVDGQQLTGRAFLDPKDMAIREEDLRPLSAVQYYTDLYEGLPGVDASRESGLRPLPRALANSYISVGHANQGRAVVPRKSTGANQVVPAKEIGRTLSRRKSLQRLPQDWPIWQLWCEIAQPRPGQDRLESPLGAQAIANETGRTVFAMESPTGSSKEEGQYPPRLIKFDDPDKPAYRIREFRPEPGASVLTSYADQSGLPADMPRRTTRVLRWVRALRETHGVDIDTNPSRAAEFQQLVQGFAALERLRAYTPGHTDTGPLTWRALERIVGAYGRQQGWDPSVTARSLAHLLHQAHAGSLSHDVVTAGAAQAQPGPATTYHAAPPAGRWRNTAPLPGDPDADAPVAGPSGTRRTQPTQPTQPDGQPPVPPTALTTTQPPGALSVYARDYGSRHDGHIGLALHEPTPDRALDGLYRQIMDALGVTPDTADGQAVRTRLGEVLDAEEIERNRPYLRSSQGHRITVHHGGRDHTVDIRLAYANPRRSPAYGRSPASLPDVQVDRSTEGSQASTDVEGSGTVRSVAVPWSASYPVNAPGALRSFDGTITMSAVHNQLSQTLTLGETFVVSSKQHAQEPSHPVDFDGLWDIRLDTPREDTGNWQPAQSHGALTVWIPEHLALEGAHTADLPEPAGLDGPPLWGVDSIAEPRRLLSELLADEQFTELSALHADSSTELEHFLSEQLLRGTAHLQRDGGVFSPTLLDASGNAVGMLQLTATIEPGRPTTQSTDGKSSLETYVTHSSNVDRVSRLTSGIGVEGSGGPSFTTDHSEGHPAAGSSFGGNLAGKASVSAQLSEGLNHVGSATLTHGIMTSKSHLVTPGRVTYHVTLHRAGGGTVSGSFGPWDDGMRLRIAQRSTAEGHRPKPSEVRRPPEYLENLDAISSSETPYAVDGAERLFQEAENHLRAEGFLPPADPTDRGRLRLDEPLVLAQLENMRRLGQMRSRFALAASSPDAVDGGHPVWFERPNSVTGTRRVQLRFSATRDTARPTEHTRRLPDVHQIGVASSESGGSRQRGTALIGALGGGGGFGVPIAGGAWTANPAPDYTATGQISDTLTAGDAVALDQVAVETEHGSELFTIPARLALDLYEGEEDDPSIRFADRVTAQADTDTADPAGTGIPLAPAFPHTVPGTLSLLVPHYRTHAPDNAAAPAGPPPGHVIRRPVTDGGPNDDFVRLNMVDRNGNPLPGITKLPPGAVVDTFRGTAALMQAMRMIAAGTYPGRPDPGRLVRAARSAVRGATDVATGAAGLVSSTAQQASTAAKNVLPQRLTGAVNRAGAGVNWALSPVTRAGKAAVTGTAATWKWTSVAVAGAALNDHTTMGSRARHAGIRPAQLVSRAPQILGSSHVVELTVPGLGADLVMVAEVRGYLRNPRLLNTERMYTEQNVTATDSASQSRAVGRARQGNIALSGTESAPKDPGALIHQANPGGRYSYARRVDESRALSANTKITHVTTEDNAKNWVGNDATLLVTFRWGVRNALGNTIGLGAFAPVTVAIDLPRSVTYLAPQQAMARLAQWFQGLAGLPSLTLQQPSVPLPDRVARTRALDFAGVLSLTQLDNTVDRRERRDRLRQELTALVEAEAPGSTQPGHSSYLEGVTAEITRLTEPTALRALLGRGPGGRVGFYFLHVAYGGARLVGVILNAEPMLQTPALRGVRGRPAPEGSGLERFTVHTAQVKSSAVTVTRTHQAAVNPISRYPRPGDPGRVDREGPSFALTNARARTRRTESGGDDRQWLRTGGAADFDDFDFFLSGSVTSQVMTAWPANIPGGIVQGGLLNLSGLEGDLAARVTAWLRRLLHGRPVRTVRVPVTTQLRFAASESVEPRQHIGPRPPALLGQDPLTLSPAQAQTLGVIPFRSGPRLVPTGPTPVYEFNAFPQLTQALHIVAPQLTASWGLPANASAEAAATRLGELVQAGEISVDLPRAAAGLTSQMPGTWPLQSPDSPPTVQISLHNPRPVTDSDAMGVDRARRRFRTFASSSTAGSSFTVNRQGTQSLVDGNAHLLGLTFPVAAQQPHTIASGGSTSGASVDRLRIGNTTAPTDRRGPRTYETLVDTVITVSGPEGTQYVTGGATVRLGERDVLGFGVTPARLGPGLYDLPAMLADQDAEDLRDWTRHPVLDLSGALADAISPEDSSAQLWLALGDDPDNTRLARALFVVSRTAATAGRSVELVVRTDDGLRHYPFTADGTLADLTDTTADTWDQFQDTVGDYISAVAAEVTARYREARLLHRQPGARRALDGARTALDAATTARRAAHGAHSDAVRRAGAVQAVLRQVATEVEEAETELARLETAADQAQRRYDSAAPEQRARHRTALIAAREAVEEAQEDLDELTGRRDSLTQDLARADRAVTDAARSLGRADARLHRATEVHRAVQSQHDGIVQELAVVRTDLRAQAWQHAFSWGQLPGLAATLDTGRRTAGTGQGASVRGSLSSAPARTPRAGRFGPDQALPAPPAPAAHQAAVSAAPGSGTSGTSGATTAARPTLPPGRLDDLAARLPGMSRKERAAELAYLSAAEREHLASDQALANALYRNRKMSRAAFAETAAQLMVQVPDGVDQPVSARREAQAQIARMLRNPAVTKRMLENGARVIVVPKSEAMTSLEPFRHLAKQQLSPGDSRIWDEVRGVSLRTTGVTEENLLGEFTSVPTETPAYPDGYSTTTHEFAHALHRFGLTPGQQKLIKDAYEARLALGDRAPWPDGPLYSRHKGRL